MLAQLIGRNLKIRYKASVLGFFWTLLNPLLMAGIYGLFMSMLGRSLSIDAIFIGVFAWQFTMMCIGDGTYLVISNGNLIRKVYFPRIILPLATGGANIINFFLMLAVLFVILIARDPGHAPLHMLTHLPVLIGIILLQLAFNLGLICLVSTANVFFRDTEHIVGILTTAWFFLSPVMYPVQLVAEHWPKALPIYLLNPMAGLLGGYRASLLPQVSTDAVAASGISPLPSFIIAALIAVGGVLLFQIKQRDFADLV
jgi:ABC-2 type transport system permease protein